MNLLKQHTPLTQAEAHALMRQVAEGALSEAQTALLIGKYMQRPPSVEELAGFRDALLEQSLDTGLDGFDTLDIVGTGGDGKDSFNISTLSAVVAAACGARVAKHGNYGVSSVSGSSNVLEHLGYRFAGEPETLRRRMERHGICFLHAPLFHPALRQVAAVRRAIGMRSVFNLLGPLVNPARPAYFVLGVSRPDQMRLYHYLLQRDRKEYRVLHSYDGYDEISLTGAFKVVSRTREAVYTPGMLGFDTCTPESLHAGSDVAAAAKIFLSVLRNEGTAPQRETVVANAGFALHCAGAHPSLPDCFSAAREAIASGAAARLFQSITQAES